MNTTKAGTPKRPRGRPPKEETMVRVNITIRPDQHDKLKALGGSTWIQERIDKARV